MLIWICSQGFAYLSISFKEKKSMWCFVNAMHDVYGWFCCCCCFFLVFTSACRYTHNVRVCQNGVNMMNETARHASTKKKPQHNGSFQRQHYLYDVNQLETRWIYQIYACSGLHTVAIYIHFISILTEIHEWVDTTINWIYQCI